MTKNRKNKKKQPTKPIAPPIQMKSRKRARKITTQFHLLTRQIDQAKKRGDDESVIQSLESQIEAMGGREAYQKASQLNTSFHSTSRWALGVLGEFGWLQGILPNQAAEENDKLLETKAQGKKEGNNSGEQGAGNSTNDNKRPCRILEVGAINTELVDAASQTRRLLKKKNNKNDNDPTITSNYMEVPKYKLSVRAIDLRSTDPKIEEADFLSVPLPSSFKHQYDAIVCSMVLNCVTNPADRGKMLDNMYQHLRPGGLCFLTIPKLCLSQSKYLNRSMFEELLVDGVGFVLERKKDSPKVAFFVLQRPAASTTTNQAKKKEGGGDDEKTHDVSKHDGKIRRRKNKKDDGMWWEKLTVINRGHKYRNEFGVTLAHR